ncbi:uncharacterized protein MONBRDRAFT_33829 [Monosiga brevicollis MX1]|uniref:Alkyl transferase n=1 Tax=Monosiga brevicollis TaxID=81824 RepID=A9V7T4_MONBE|nr:uncharacterized protein MONBRDRAFT_33829 [Monosiga brevicollis MX1]EDQ86432.1 predicted protein [Monosiga brevicollis MX1]|eukprot:XP_001748822.1 hypothetical protein [Monosiga brevicollis MX1]
MFDTALAWLREPQQQLQAALRWAAVQTLRAGKLPKHVAFIMDGNRRFARQRHIARIAGHSAGFDKLKETLQWCLDLDIRIVSVYAFSIENFNRSKEEVDALMQLALEKFETLLDESEVLHQHQVSVRIVGNMDLLPEALQRVLGKVVYETRAYTKAILNVCFAYTARDDITTAANRILTALDEGRIQSWLISVYLLEYYHPVWFTKVLWPDFGFYDMLECIVAYQRAAPVVSRLRAQQFAVEQQGLRVRLNALLAQLGGEGDGRSSPFEAGTRQSEKVAALEEEQRYRVQTYVRALREAAMARYATLAAAYDHNRPCDAAGKREAIPLTRHTASLSLCLSVSLCLSLSLYVSLSVCLCLTSPLKIALKHHDIIHFIVYY